MDSLEGNWSWTKRDIFILEAPHIWGCKQMNGFRIYIYPILGNMAPTIALPENPMSEFRFMG
jgi:hypothetical protein